MADPVPPPGLAPTVGTVVGAVLVVTGAAVTVPSPRRHTVLATGPWAVVGGVLHALAVSGAYSGVLGSVFGSVLAVPATVLLAGAVCLPLAGIGRLREQFDPTGYLIATGLGALLLPLVAVLLRGEVTAATMAPVVVVPLAAGLATVAIALSLGLGGATALAEARSLGLFALYGQAFGAIALAVAVDALGAPARGPLVGSLVGLGSAVGVADRLGATWPFVLLSLAGGGLLVVGLARLLDEHETAVYLTLGAVGALGLGPGVARLLLAGPL